MKSSELEDYPEAPEMSMARELLSNLDMDSLEYFQIWIKEEIEHREWIGSPSPIKPGIILKEE